METKQKNDTRAVGVHSKFDSTGTDPNRYGAYYSDEQAAITTKDKSKSKKTIPGVEPNISTFERIATIIAGGYLLYDALAGKKKSVLQGITGGTLLARGISGYCPVYDFAERSGTLKSSNININTVLTIDKPVSEVYAFWRKLENLPKFMKHLESVNETDNVTSEWRAKGPAGIGHISWKATILMDEKDQMLSWHSLPGSTIDNAGKILFRDRGNNTTELDVTISYHVPLGIPGEAAARLLNPVFTKMVESDIESFKSFLENSENKPPLNVTNHEQS